MSQEYNPIVRTFGRFRAALLSGGEVARRDVRPATPLESVLPVESRRATWRRLHRQGFRLPPLRLSRRDDNRNFVGVLRATVAFALCLQRWSGLLVALPLGLVTYWVSRRRAVEFPPGLRTVGEAVFYLTSVREHKSSGYRWTRHEIALKVRRIVAESVGLPLDAVQERTTLAEVWL
jgi:hypothetical protein